MKNHITSLSFLLALSLIFYACQPQSTTKSADTARASMASTGNASEANIPVVEVEPAQERTFSGNLEITGTLVANQSVALRAMEGGFLSTISKDIGDYVSAGSTIAVLENPELRQAMKLAEANVSTHMADVKHAEARMKSIQAQLDYKRSFYNRLKGIYDQTPDLITIDELENAKAEMLMAEAEVEVGKAQTAVIQSKVNAANAKVEAAKIRVGNLRVKAPFSGFITQRYLDKGAFVQSAVSNAAASAIFDIVDINKLRLVIEYPESDISNIGVGSDVDIEFPELPGKNISAKITRMAAAMNPKSKTVRAEIDIPKPDKALKPGMYAHVKSKIQSKQSNLCINKQAIAAIKNKPYIYKVVDGKVQKIAVTLGLEDKEYIEVLSGDLKKNDLVVVKGKGMINEGMPVKTKTKAK